MASGKSAIDLLKEAKEAAVSEGDFDLADSIRKMILANKKKSAVFDATLRLSAWVRDFGESKGKPFIDDLSTLIAYAREHMNGDI